MAVRILLIDDDADDRFLFCEALKQVDDTIICETAEDGQEALVKLNGPPLPNYIFLDLNMPVMSGFECLAHLKKIPDLEKTPVIIYSTSKNSVDIKRTASLGAAAYLKKPGDFNELCDKLQDILDYDFNSNIAPDL